LNGDGFSDVVIASANANSLYTNQNGNAFVATALPTSGGVGAIDVLLVDVVGSPLPDLIFVYANGPAVRHENLGAGTFGAAVTIDAGPVSAAASADFNRDGHADVFPDLEKEFGLGMTTPREMAKLFELLAEGRVVSRAASDEMLAILEKQFDRQMIPRSLPFETAAITIANKTGWDEEKLADTGGFKGDVRNDAAYVKGPRGRYVIAILARRGKDKSPGVDSEALVTGGRISRLVYDAWAAPRLPPGR